MESNFSLSSLQKAQGIDKTESTSSQTSAVLMKRESSSTSASTTSKQHVQELNPLSSVDRQVTIQELDDVSSDHGNANLGTLIPKDSLRSFDSHVLTKRSHETSIEEPQHEVNIHTPTPQTGTSSGSSLSALKPIAMIATVASFLPTVSAVTEVGGTIATVSATNTTGFITGGLLASVSAPLVIGTIVGVIGVGAFYYFKGGDNKDNNEQVQQSQSKGSLSVPAPQLNASEILQNKQIVPIDDDGNCLFRAFSAGKTGNQRGYNAIKNKILNEIRNNPDLLSLVPDAGYLGRMKKERSWGGELEIAAFAKAYDQPVRLYRDDNTVVDYPAKTDTGSQKQPIEIIHTDRQDKMHFDLVVNQQPKVQQPKVQSSHSSDSTHEGKRSDSKVSLSSSTTPSLSASSSSELSSGPTPTDIITRHAKAFGSGGNASSFMRYVSGQEDSGFASKNRDLIRSIFNNTNSPPSASSATVVAPTRGYVAPTLSPYTETIDKTAGADRLTKASKGQIREINNMILIEETIKKYTIGGLTNISGGGGTLLSMDENGKPGERPRTGYRIDIQGDNSDGTIRLQLQTNGQGTTSIAEVNVNPNKHYTPADIIKAFKDSLKDSTVITLN